MRNNGALVLKTASGSQGTIISIIYRWEPEPAAEKLNDGLVCERDARVMGYSGALFQSLNQYPVSRMGVSIAPAKLKFLLLIHFVGVFVKC